MQLLFSVHFTFQTLNFHQLWLLFVSFVYLRVFFYGFDVCVFFFFCVIFFVVVDLGSK